MSHDRVSSSRVGVDADYGLRVARCYRLVASHVQVNAGLYDRAIENCDRVLAVDPPSPVHVVQHPDAARGFQNGQCQAPRATLSSPSPRFGEIVCAGLRNAVIWIGEPTVRPVAGSNLSPCRL